MLYNAKSAFVQLSNVRVFTKRVEASSSRAVVPGEIKNAKVTTKNVFRPCTRTRTRSLVAQTTFDARTLGFVLTISHVWDFSSPDVNKLRLVLSSMKYACNPVKLSRTTLARRTHQVGG